MPTKNPFPARRAQPITRSGTRCAIEHTRTALVFRDLKTKRQSAFHLFHGLHEKDREGSHGAGASVAFGLSARLANLLVVAFQIRCYRVTLNLSD